MATMHSIPVATLSIGPADAIWPSPAAEMRGTASRGFPAAIEAEVIPRLMLQRGGPLSALAPPTGLVLVPLPGLPDIDALLPLMLRSDDAAALELVESLRVRGVGIDRIYLDLLAPVARQLGQMWTDDLCDFATVTLGLVSLQRLRQRLAPGFAAVARAGEPLRRILLTTVPGEQHLFGQSVVADFFRHARWEVWSSAESLLGSTIALVRQEWFDIVGFSVSGSDRLDALAAAIRAIRRASCNPGLGVMVGGPVFSANPDFAIQVGADATASDAKQATLQAERLLALLARRR